MGVTRRLGRPALDSSQTWASGPRVSYLGPTGRQVMMLPPLLLLLLSLLLLLLLLLCVYLGGCRLACLAILATYRPTLSIQPVKTTLWAWTRSRERGIEIESERQRGRRRNW